MGSLSYPLHRFNTEDSILTHRGQQHVYRGQPVLGIAHSLLANLAVRCRAAAPKTFLRSRFFEPAGSKPNQHHQRKYKKASTREAFLYLVGRARFERATNWLKANSPKTRNLLFLYVKLPASLFQDLASNIHFCFDEWAALNCALMDYRDNPNVDLSDCLIARRAHSRGASTLYTFDNEKKLGALPIATTLSPPS